jgi:hypothetical protein
MTPARALAWGSGVVGTIDFLYASLFLALTGRPWYRAWQGVASAVMGEASFSGGPGTAALGIVLHFMVAACIVGVYLVAGRWLPFLRRNVLIWGVGFGVIAFFGMNLVVIPLTRIGRHPLVWSAFTIGGLVLHALLLGPAAAYFAARASWSAGRTA